MGQTTQINGLLSPLLQKIRIKKAKKFIKFPSILDIGCSNGELIQHINQKIKYVGIEGNQQYFKEAKRRNPTHQFINIYINKSNVNHLNIDIKFDTIIMLAILEHFDQPEIILVQLQNYLKHNGRIIITTPTNYSEKILKIGSKIRFFSNEMDEHRNHFTKKELLSICTKTNLHITHYEKFEFSMNQLIVLDKVSK